MASKTFSGQLDQAMNEAAAEGNKILFIPQQTVGEVLPGAASELVVESDGTYSIKLAYNTYSIYHYSDVTKRKTLLATDIVVSTDTAVTTIPDLLGSVVPVTEDSVLTIQGYLDEANEAKTDAEAAQEATEALFDDFDSSVADSISLINDSVPSLGAPFCDSGRLNYGFGTEYVTGLPVFGVDATRSTSIDLLQIDGSFRTFDSDRPGISFQGISLNSGLTNVVTNNSDMTTWSATNASLSLDSSDRGFNVYNLIGTADSNAHSTTLTASTSNGSEYTMYIYAKTNDTNYLRLVFRTQSYSNRAIAVYALDGSGDVTVSEEVNLTVADASSVTAGDIVWIRLTVEFDDGVDTSTLTPVMSVADSTGSTEVAGDGTSALLSFGGVNIFEQYNNVPLNIATSGSSSTVAASNISVTAQGNVPTAQNFTVRMDIPRRGYGRLITLTSDSTEVIGIKYERYLNGGGGMDVNNNYVYNDILSESEDVMRVVFVFDYTLDYPLMYIDGDNYTSPQSEMTTLIPSNNWDTIYIGKNSASGGRFQSSVRNFAIYPYAASADEVKSWGAPK